MYVYIYVVYLCKYAYVLPRRCPLVPISAGAHVRSTAAIRRGHLAICRNRWRLGGRANATLEQAAKPVCPLNLSMQVCFRLGQVRYSLAG